MFTIETGSRSAWRKSTERAIERVLDGRMSEEEFAEIAVPSPDPRDPAPEEMLSKRRAAAQVAADAELLSKQAREREVAETAAFVAANHADQVWRLCGAYIEDTSCDTYTLDEIRAWADWARAYLGSERPELYATSGKVSLSLAQNLYCTDRRSTDYARAAKDLREFVSERTRAAN